MRNSKKAAIVPTAKVSKSAGKKAKANAPVVVDQALIHKRQ